MKTMMKTRHFTAILAVCAMLLLAGCGENAAEKKAGELLEQAQQMLDKGEYEKVKTTIDSLRKNFPEAIEARKKGLRLYQESELKRAQGLVERADTALQRVEREYQEMKAEVDKLREKSAASEEQLRAVNLLRVKRDSLKAAFDVECAKIKYIKKKMEE
jgi:outer membrane murein-binding lipoprotein Lpp